MADETCTPCDDVIDICISTGPPGPRGNVGKITQFIFYPPVGTTDITGTDKSGNLMEVDPDGCLVSINGVMLEPGADYIIAADGLTVTLTEGIVNANDVLTVQTWKSDEQASDDVLDLKLDVEKNTSDIAGLDVRVTQNEDDIETLQNAAQSFTTRDVKVSGVNTTRAVDEPLQTQQDVNVHLDRSIADAESRIDTLESGQPTLDADLEDLRNDTDENTQGISDNATAINDLTDIVSDNVDDISSLQNQVNSLPPPTDISELEEDVDDIAKQVGSNTLAIAKNASDIAALPEMTIDLEPLSDAIETNAAGISVNASDIKNIKSTDAKQQSEINDLKSDVIELQNTEFDLTGLAVVDEDNKFSASQTIKDGVTITGSKAFLNLDKGSPLSISNGNFSNSVVEIKRSTGDTAISLEASGHIRGVKTDTDPSCAVSLEYFQANVGAGGGDVDMSKYATKLELTDEEKARILGDQKLAADLDEAIKTEKYNDTAITNRLAAEEKAREAGDSTLSNQIANETQYRKDEDAKLQKAIDELEIPGVDVDLYATVTFVEESIADFATENFVEEAIGAIEFPEIPEVDLDGYATEEFVTNAIDAIEFPELPEGLATEAYVTDAVDAQAQVQANIDRLQQQEIEINSDKIEALEGTTLDAKYRCSSRPAPNIGEFALANISNEQTFEWEACEYIKLTKTDFNNVTHDFGMVLNGDLIRLASSATNYCTYRVVDKSEGESAVTLQVTFDTRGNDDSAFETLPYNFTHFQNLNVASFATIEYSDDRDEATLEAAQADAAANYLSLEDGGAVAGHVNFKEGIKLSGGKGKQFIEAANGVTGKLLYDNVDQTDEEKQRFSWGANSNYCWVPLDMKDNSITHMADPEPSNIHAAVTVNYLNEALGTLDVGSLDEYATLEYVDAQLDNTLKLNGDGYTFVEQPWKLRADTGNGTYTYLALENDKLGIYHVKDPTAEHHVANRRYVEDNYAALKETNTFTDVQTFDKSIYALNGVVFNGRNGATAMEIRGENESLSDIWCKVRGTNRLSFICYPGQDNVGYKRVIEMHWNDEKNNPELHLNYIADPTNNGDAANKRYVDQEIAKVGGGSDGATANSGTTTPNLAVGEMFFNTTSKILFIGDS